MSRSQVDEIKERLDIVEIARSYLSNVKKQGANYFALCPFHQEKTPSFSLNPDLGIFKCFGCGESGDVLSFIQKVEGIEFPEALEIAAKRAGVKLEKRYSKEDEKLHKEKQSIYKVNALVTEYYHYILTKHKMGEKGRNYIKKRKVSKELLGKFKVGYASRAYTNLRRFLISKGYKLNDLVRWGLIVSRDGRVYDKFRSRVIFPLIDHRGNIVGFSGRTILENTKAPKYLHSPQTRVFDKSKFLYGLEQAKNEIRKEKFVVFVEGQLDVISSHKTTVKNIVASLGTSLSEGQLKLAKRYTDSIYFAYDNDLAGEKALIRSANLAHQEEFDVKAITIPKGKDADELINTNRAEWKKVVKDAELVIDHMIRRLYERLDLSKVKDKEEFSKMILPLVSALQSKVKQSHYLHRVALFLNIDESILAEELEKTTIHEDSSISVDTKRINKILRSPRNVREDYLLSLILQYEQFINLSLRIVKIRHFLQPRSSIVCKKLKEYVKKKKSFSIKKFISSLDETEKKFANDLLLADLKKSFEDEIIFNEEVGKVTKYLKKRYLKSKAKEIEKLVKSAEGREEVELTKKLKKIAKELGKM